MFGNDHVQSHIYELFPGQFTFCICTLHERNATAIIIILYDIRQYFHSWTAYDQTEKHTLGVHLWCVVENHKKED